MTYRYFKMLIWAQKKFSSCGRPTTVIVDSSTMVSKNDFFQKFTKLLIDTLKRLFRPEKNFCFYDHPNVVIVDLPTIVSQKNFFESSPNGSWGPEGAYSSPNKISASVSLDYSDRQLFKVF